MGSHGPAGRPAGLTLQVLYDPEAPAGKRITELASSRIHRYYHSNALLLPSGDVWVAGSELGKAVRRARLQGGQQWGEGLKAAAPLRAPKILAQLV
jgi:hypothetical protein